MDQVYRDAYSALYVRLRGAPQMPAGPNALLRADVLYRDVGEIIEQEVSREKPMVRVLRPDAKVLLLTNFVQMIAMPVTVAGRLERQQLMESIRSDVALLVQDAKPDQQNEISGHAIVDALNRNWSSLATTALRVWE